MLVANIEGGRWISIISCIRRSSYSNHPQQSMADHADDGDNDIFVYRGGRAPLHITTHVLIDESIDEIEDNAFRHCMRLVQVDTHDGIRRVGKNAFFNCRSLRRINLKSVFEIGHSAFYNCYSLESVEFGDRLETIGESALSVCTSLKHLKLPSIINIGRFAFFGCNRLTDIELSERLETLGVSAFCNCESLQRIAMPLKRDLFTLDHDLQRYNQFDDCDQLATVNIVGGIDKTVVSLHMEGWRTEMIAEINRINQVLPGTPAREKTAVIKVWMDSVMDNLDHYKSEHYRYVKEGITLLELALWKARLDENKGNAVERDSKKAKVDAESARNERRITSGADIVIKNVLPFLKLN